MCVINVNISTINDLYFVITNTILSLDKELFSIDDVINELKQNMITEESVPVAKGHLRKSVELCVQNLIEHGKVIEEPRIFHLVK